MPLLGPDGEILKMPARHPASRGDLVQGRPRFKAALSGGSIAPYDGSDTWNADMSGWLPYLGSPDTEINPYRDMMVSRVRDLVRNNGWAAGAVTKLLDAVIGPYLRLVAKPDWMALKQFGKGFDDEWAMEFAEAVEAKWRGWADDIGRWCDISRRLTFSELSRLAFRHELVDGESLTISHWEPRRLGLGRASYATCIQIVDPDRLSNPQQLPDQPFMRGGVEIDEYGAAVAYHIRRAHRADWFVPERAWTWERVPRETREGRSIIIHHFDSDRAAQHRAVGGILKPILGRFRMQHVRDDAELKASLINAVLAAWIETSFDPLLTSEQFNDALTAEDMPGIRAAAPYQALRDEFHGANPAILNGVRIPQLLSGERINSLNTSRPGSNFEAFHEIGMRNISSAIAGLSSPQVSGNWADVNYSSARAAMLDAWKTMGRMRIAHGRGFAQPIYANWLEEEFDRGELPLPPNAPEFCEARNAYARCGWMGPGRGWVDPLNERRGAVLGLDAAFSTLEAECAEQGLDYREVIAQRRYEYKLMEGMPRPEWQDGTQDATKSAAPPEAR